MKKMIILLGTLVAVGCGGGGGGGEKSSGRESHDTAPITETASYSDVFACGNNARGSLGNDSAGILSAQVVEVEGLSGVRAMAAGLFHTVALMEDGTLRAWGDNSLGQLGNGSSLNFSYVPTSVVGLDEIVAVSAGAFHTVAVDRNGNVWAWGNNTTGQLGTGALGPAIVENPARIEGLPRVTAVACGMGHTLALDENGFVWAWGNSFLGQLGNPNLVDAFTILEGVFELIPEEVPQGEELWTWLIQLATYLGDELPRTISTVPVRIESLSEVKGIAAGSLHSLAVLRDGTVRAWGSDLFGELGDGKVATLSVAPVQSQMLRGLSVDYLTDVATVAGGALHSIALRSDGTVYAWGFNGEGQLGIGAAESALIPASPFALRVKNLADVTAVSLTLAHSVALLGDGRAVSWGLNISGQLGNGLVSASAFEPVEVAGISNATAVAAGGAHSVFAGN